MKTAVDKNESSFAKMKRESLEWLERNGKAAPPFIALAVNLSHEPVTAKTERENYGITDKIIEEEMNINTPFFGNSGAKVPMTEQETNEQPKSVSDEEKTPESIFKDFASFNKFLYDLTQYEMEVIIAMLYEQKAYASQHPIEQENLTIAEKKEINEGYRSLDPLFEGLEQQEKPSEQPIAYEFHCIESGQCYVDYVRRTELEHSDETYVQKPLFYARQKHLPTDCYPKEFVEWCIESTAKCHPKGQYVEIEGNKEFKTLDELFIYWRDKIK